MTSTLNIEATILPVTVTAPWQSQSDLARRTDLRRTRLRRLRRPAPISALSSSKAPRRESRQQWVF